MFLALHAICCTPKVDAEYRTNKLCNGEKAAAFADSIPLIFMVVQGIFGIIKSNSLLPSTSNWLLVGLGLIGLASLVAHVRSNTTQAQKTYVPLDGVTSF